MLHVNISLKHRTIEIC